MAATSVSLWHQVRLLIWRYVWLSRVRRHWAATVAEIVFMVLVMWCVWDESVAPYFARPHLDWYFDSVEPTTLWGRPNESWSVGELAFAPNHTFFVNLMERVSRKIPGNWKSVPFGDAEEAARYAESAGDSGHVRRVAVWFDRPADDKLTYHVRFPDGRFDTQDDYKHGLLVPEPADIDRFDEMRLLVPLQYLVESTFVDEVAAALSKPLQHEVKLLRLPYPGIFYGSEEHTLTPVVVRFAISYFVPFCALVLKLVQEKRTGQRDMLRSVGLSDPAYWLGHFCNTGCVMACAILLMYVPLFVYRNESGTPFLELADPTVVLTVLAAFSALVIAHAMLLSIFFWNTCVAFGAAVVYWLLLCLAPYVVLQNMVGLGYDMTKRSTKLASVLSPVMYLQFTLKIIERFEKYDVRLTWTNSRDYDTTFDDVNLSQHIAYGVGVTAIMGCIVCYLDNVVPWGYGVPKPLYYFLKMEYWHPTKQFELRGMSSSRDTRFYEPDPKDSTAVVHMVNLCAKGQNNSADVTDVNLTVLDTQITVILGPPNCGSSTILEVLKGKLVPTSGAAYVCNYSVDSISGATAVNVSAFLDERALFDNLTVEEHLFFYALVGSTDADAYVDWALNAVRMEPYKDCLVSQLSPRLRTSLCMAIAMCRVKQARLMIFDEPTRLMDERHRRSMWLTLEDVAKYSAVLVTTSSVEDAEMLAHRLVIMNQGRVVCAGSPGWLKTRFGVGCYLRLTTMRSFRAERVTRIVQQHMGPVEPVRVTCLEAVFNLTVTATNIKNMASMLHTLEKMRNSLGIMHMRLSSCSLEDIFVKLAHRTAVKETPDAGDAQGATVPTVMDTAKAVEEADALKQLCSARGSEADVWSVLCALFLKRALMWRRVWWTKSLSVLLPAASLVMLALCEHHFLPARAAPRNNATYVLRTFFDDTKTQGFVEVVDNASKPFGHSVVLPTMAEHGVQTFSPKTINVDRELLFWAEQGNVYDYIRHYQFGVSLLNKSGGKLPVFLWFNGQCPHSAALVVNMFHTALLRDCTGKKDSAITLVNSLSLNDSLSEKIEYERVHGRLSLPAGRTRLGHETELFTERNVITRAFHSFFLSLAASSYSASHVVAPMTEQKSGLKHLQLMSGMSGFVYWMGHFLFDFCMAAGSSYFLTAIMYFSHSGSETIYYRKGSAINLLS